MARTRNLNPGRVAALRYAFAVGHRHKRLVYALLLGLAGAEPARAAQAGPAPCVACQALSVPAEQPPAWPQALNGLQVLVRVAPGADPGVWRPLVEGIRARGGRPGLDAAGIPGPSDPILSAEADTLVIEPLDGDLERVAYELKQGLAAARGARPQMRLLIAAADAMATALRDRGLAPYVDGFVAPADRLRDAGGLVTPGTEPFRLRALPDAPDQAAAIVAAAAALQTWFPDGLVAVRDRALTCGSDRMPTFLNPRTLDLVGVASCPAPAVVASDMAGAPVDRYDLASSSAFLARAGGGDRFAEAVDVAGARALTVDEIVARHQAVAARQNAAIVTDIATGTLTLTFEAPGFIAPITITSETTIFQGRTTEVRQANIRVNGVPFNANGGVPRLPIIEPERAAAPPLAITLSDVYRYQLAGRETIRGVDTYVVSFAPRSAGESLFAGRAWIDARTFGMVRVSAAQTGLKGPITASEQTDDFSRDAEGRWLLLKTDVRQTYEGASVRTPIHRALAIARHDVNAGNFDGLLRAAHASLDVMLRETPQGFRYLARQRAAPMEAPGAPVAPLRALAGRAERIRTLAFGVIIDPNISIPLPFAGLSYVDFNLFGTGMQFNGFFGGSYGQLAFSVPSLGRSRWQLAGRAFGIASSYNDRAFERGRERYELDIRQRPAEAAVWLLRPLSPRTAFRLEYDWDYNRFARGSETTPLFTVPRNQNAHAIRAGFDAQRAGWQASVWASYARRVGWRRWGLPDGTEYSKAHDDFQRYGASLLRTTAVSPRLTLRMEVAAMGGRDLDRFSRYAFGTFDNRLHGYPAALIRYDRGAVLRTASAWSLGPVRLDGFADAAAVHDPGFGRGYGRYAGLGSAIEAPGPFRTLLSVEWGYGFQGIGTNGRTGTQVLRLSGYKVF